MMDGVGAVVCAVKVEPSDRTTVCA
jgi:hypothetical protein